eukprot:Sspe_Gene.86631::Locus_57351_Transcript_1_1_Confidence_1.000_Length_1664::g.86631::m.86631
MPRLLHKAPAQRRSRTPDPLPSQWESGLSLDNRTRAMWAAVVEVVSSASIAPAQREVLRCYLTQEGTPLHRVECLAEPLSIVPASAEALSSSLQMQCFRPWVEVNEGLFSRKSFDTYLQSWRQHLVRWGSPTVMGEPECCRGAGVLPVTGSQCYHKSRWVGRNTCCGGPALLKCVTCKEVFSEGCSHAHLHANHEILTNDPPCPQLYGMVATTTLSCMHCKRDVCHLCHQRRQLATVVENVPLEWCEGKVIESLELALLGTRVVEFVRWKGTCYVQFERPVLGLHSQCVKLEGKGVKGVTIKVKAPHLPRRVVCPDRCVALRISAVPFGGGDWVWHAMWLMKSGFRLLGAVRLLRALAAELGIPVAHIVYALPVEQQGLLVHLASPPPSLPSHPAMIRVYHSTLPTGYVDFSVSVHCESPATKVSRLSTLDDRACMDCLPPEAREAIFQILLRSTSIPVLPLLYTNLFTPALEGSECAFG